MFPLAHVYFAHRVLGDLEPEELVGAVLPDALILSGMKWEESHRMADRLYRAARASVDNGGRPDPVRLARAVVTHGADPHGLDYYGDKSFAGGCGYSFELARPIAARAANVCGLPAELGWWKGHNFVEMAVELVVAAREPRCGEALAQALSSPDLLEGVAAFVAGALKLEPEALAKGLAQLPSFLQLRAVSAALLAQKYTLQVQVRHGAENVDVAGVEDLILECFVVVEPTIDEFFSRAEAAVRRTLREYPLPYAAGAAG